MHRDNRRYDHQNGGSSRGGSRGYKNSGYNRPRNNYQQDDWNSTPQREERSYNYQQPIQHQSRDSDEDWDSTPQQNSSNYNAPQQNNWRSPPPPVQQESRGSDDDWGSTPGKPMEEYAPRNYSSSSYNRRNDYNNRNEYNNRDEPGTKITVPGRCVSMIIGRGGSRINSMQRESGARIKVNKSGYGEDAEVILTGNESSIEQAKKLINEVVQENSQEAPSQSYQQPSEDPPKAINWQEFFKECDEKEKEAWEKFGPIVKEFYSEHPEITAMTEEEVAEFRLNSNNVVVDRTFKTDESKPIPKPVKFFYQAFHNYPEILEEIRKAGFETPSPIQSQAWPVLLSGEDLIGIAQTGTGKTLAFLLPAMVHIDGQPGERSKRGGPAVLIMAPTRELALQIDKEIKKYQYRGITSVCLYGGGSRSEQIKVVTGGVDIIIATPGRLNDLVASGKLNVKTVTYVVLDEADRMLDMGFEPQIRKVMYMIRPTRQTVMTSATWPMGVRRLATSYMVDPVQVYVGTLDLAAVHTVTQTIVMMPEGEEAKYQTLFNFAREMKPEHKVIVFCGKKARADELSSELAMHGISCQTMHGDRDQSDREQALKDIADGTVQILIATDVASRGLDIEDISHVINYDFPRNIEEYVHRVGRTGRAGRYGESISYFTRQDWGQASEVIPILEEAEQYVPGELYDMAKRYKVWKEKKDAEGPPRRGGFGGRNRW